jgi:hypothetical protein
MLPQIIGFHFIILPVVHCDIYKSVHSVSYLHSPHPSLSFFLPLHFLRTVSTGHIVPFSYLNAYCFYHILPTSSFPYALPPPTGTNFLIGIILLSCPSSFKNNLWWLSREFHCALWQHPFLISSSPHWYQHPDRKCVTFLISVLLKRHFC